LRLGSLLVGFSLTLVGGCAGLILQFVFQGEKLRVVRGDAQPALDRLQRLLLLPGDVMLRGFVKVRLPGLPFGFGLRLDGLCPHGAKQSKSAPGEAGHEKNPADALPPRSSC